MSAEARSTASLADAMRRVAQGLQESAQAQRTLTTVLPAARLATNAGAVGATVARTTLASDDPAVAHLATIIARLDSAITLLTAIRDRLPAALDAGGGMKVHETP